MRETCSSCGGTLKLVRPGVLQCEFPKCRKYGIGVARDFGAAEADNEAADIQYRESMQDAGRSHLLR